MNTRLSEKEITTYSPQIDKIIGATPKYLHEDMCPRCGEELDIGFYPGKTVWDDPQIKWIFFCGHGFERTLNWNRGSIREYLRGWI